MRSTNPAMRVIKAQAGQMNFGGTDSAATLAGSANKSLLLVAITFICGYFAMNYINFYNSAFTSKTILIGGVIITLAVALITIFKPNLAPITAPIYAVVEGVTLGIISQFFEFKYPGIVSTAVISTFSVVMVMLALWKFKIIVATAKFRAIVTGATLGVAVVYLLNMLLSLFNIDFLPHTGALSIAISLVVCTIAAFNLILDFDNMEQSVQMGLPKYFEYFNAFSLLVTICWLYIEILNLLSKRE